MLYSKYILIKNVCKTYTDFSSFLVFSCSKNIDEGSRIITKINIRKKNLKKLNKNNI